MTHRDIHFDQPDTCGLHEECLPITISVDPAYVERLEQVAARTGRTAEQLLEDFMTRVFGPFGGRIVR